MAKIKPALLRNPDEITKETFRIRLVLQQRQTATFTFTDKHTAREYYDTLRTIGVIGGSAIRDIHFDVISDAQ